MIHTDPATWFAAAFVTFAFIGLGVAGYMALGPAERPEPAPRSHRPGVSVARVFARLLVWGGLIALFARWTL